MLLVVGIAEFGRAWMTQNILTGAAREAVRILAVPPGIVTPEDRADNVLSTAGITAANVSVDDPGVAFGPVSVSITYNFPTAVVGFIPGLDNIPLSSTTTMRREY
jgi:Flp pilus assembly protein TadG